MVVIMPMTMSVALPVLMAVIVTVAGVVVGVSHANVLSDDGIRRDHRRPG
jgi:hypothetical protein